ncbi:hypothetical protein Tco_0641823 [Tanacetum coccineum]
MDWESYSQILDSRGAIPQTTLSDAKEERSKKVNEKVYEVPVGCEQSKTPLQSKDCPLEEEGKNPTKKKLTTSQFALTDVAIRNQGASIKTLEIQIGQMSKVLQERGFGCLPRSTEANPRDQVKSISTTIEADSCLIRRIGSYQYDVSTGHSRTLMYEANNDEFRSNIV